MTNDIDINDFVKFYKMKYNRWTDRRYSKDETWKFKAYCYAAIKIFGFSINRAAKAINRHHTTLMYHLKSINDQNSGDAWELIRDYSCEKEKEKIYEQYRTN